MTCPKGASPEQAGGGDFGLVPWLGAPRFELGSVLALSGRRTGAIEILEQGHLLDPADVRGLRMLGQIHLEQGLADTALRLLEAAAIGAPADADVMSNLGLARQTAGNLEGAEACYRSALQIKPAHPSALRGMGRLLELGGRSREGISLLSPVVRSSSRDGELLAVFGRLLQQDNRGGEATELLEKSLVEMQEDKERIHVLFQLAALHDTAGQWEQAFDCCRQANRLKQADFKPIEYRVLVDRLLAAFDEQSMRALPRADNEDARPVFIVGMPRSGTSLVEQIIASHPDAHGAGELADIGHLALATAGDGLDYPESATRLDRDPLASMADVYLQRLDQVAPKERRITDNMWEDFEYTCLISMDFPASRGIA